MLDKRQRWSDYHAAKHQGASAGVKDLDRHIENLKNEQESAEKVLKKSPLTYQAELEKATKDRAETQRIADLHKALLLKSSDLRAHIWRAQGKAIGRMNTAGKSEALGQTGSLRARRALYGGLGLAGAGALAYHIHKNKKAAEMPKEAADDSNKINWKKVMAVAALTGLGASALKGLGEKSLEEAVKKRLVNKNIHPWLKEKLPWTISRGVTGAGSGVIYGAGTAIGLSKGKKKDHKK
jgi:hypothetical protein